MVDTTVQEKNIAFPTDSKLYNGMRLKLVSTARALGITLANLWQGMPDLVIGRYAHAKQYKRMGKAVKKVKAAWGAYCAT